MTRVEQIAIQLLVRNIRLSNRKLDDEIYKLPQDPKIYKSYLRELIDDTDKALDKISEIAKEVQK